jgi:hypothetical protein
MKYSGASPTTWAGGGFAFWNVPHPTSSASTMANLFMGDDYFILRHRRKSLRRGTCAHRDRVPPLKFDSFRHVA